MLIPPSEHRCKFFFVVGGSFAKRNTDRSDVFDRRIIRQKSRSSILMSCNGLTYSDQIVTFAFH